MDVFENIEKRIKKVSKFMELSEEEKDYLLKPKFIHQSKLKINNKEFLAWRIIHNNSLGPGKGGIRFHENVSKDEIMSLSFWMSLKNSLVGLPYGGAKGGIKVNTQNFSKKELEELSREYIKAFHKFLGKNKDIPAPDVNTNSQIMSWMLDEFEKIKGHHEPAMITGKPLDMGGCFIREEATAAGGKIILEQFLNKINKKPEEIKIAVQGFGNVGMNIAKLLHINNYNVVAVSDVRGGIFFREGLDIKKVINHSNKTGSVINFENSKNISNDELLSLDIDVLIPAAIENQITEKNVKDIKAKYILELANGPITFNAEETLLKNGVIVIPDILANSGGVIASYCEWSNNRSGQIYFKEEMEKVLRNKIINAFHRVYEFYQEKKNENSEFDMRTAAYIIAIKRILNVTKIRGGFS